MTQKNKTTMEELLKRFCRLSETFLFDKWVWKDEYKYNAEFTLKRIKEKIDKKWARRMEKEAERARLEGKIEVLERDWLEQTKILYLLTQKYGFLGRY